MTSDWSRRERVEAANAGWMQLEAAPAEITPVEVAKTGEEDSPQQKLIANWKFALRIGSPCGRRCMEARKRRGERGRASNRLSRPSISVSRRLTKNPPRRGERGGRFRVEGRDFRPS